MKHEVGILTARAGNHWRRNKLNYQRRRACTAFARSKMSCGLSDVLELRQYNPTKVCVRVVHPGLHVSDQVGRRIERITAELVDDCRGACRARKIRRCRPAGRTPRRSYPVAVL